MNNPSQTHPFIHQKKVLILGGTGAFARALVRRLLEGAHGTPEKITLFSRDEAKQHDIRLQYLNQPGATDDIIYNNFRRLLEFRLGDANDERALLPALQNADVVINACAMRQLPACEYFPQAALKANVESVETLTHLINAHRLPVQRVINISSDKACKPVSAMGMSKALQERLIVSANIGSNTRFINVRMAESVTSASSFALRLREQIVRGGPAAIAHPDMTRFLPGMAQAVDAVLHALANANAGETYVPHMPAAYAEDIARAMIGHLPVEVHYSGLLSGDKLHDVVISEDEWRRTVQRGKYYVICPLLPELLTPETQGALWYTGDAGHEYASAQVNMDPLMINSLLQAHRLLPPVEAPQEAAVQTYAEAVF